MATRNIVPRANEEGGLGTASKKWLYGFLKTLAATTVNALTLTAQAIGFTIAGGTTSKTLTVDETVAISDKAAKTHGALHLPNAADPIGLPKFSAHKNGTDQEGIVTITPTKVTFPTEEYDVGGAYDAANSKWVPGIIGKVHVDAVLYWAAGVDQTLYFTEVYLNGVVYRAPAVQASGTGALGTPIDIDVPITAVTDYIEIYGYQASGSNKVISGLSYYTWFMGHMLP